MYQVPVEIWVGYYLFMREIKKGADWRLLCFELGKF